MFVCCCPYLQYITLLPGSLDRGSRSTSIFLHAVHHESMLLIEAAHSPHIPAWSAIILSH